MIKPRLIPIVLVAMTALLGLKGLELWSHDGAGGTAAAADQTKPGSKQIDLTAFGIDPVVTGSSAGGHDEPAAAAQTELSSDVVKPSQTKTTVSTERPEEAAAPGGDKAKLTTEQQLLLKLGERRKQIDEREKELQLREELLKATEGKIDTRVDELKAIQDKLGTSGKSQEDEKSKELDGIVKMYESMKAKDAARIFDRLDVTLLVDIGRQMNPKKLGDIVSKMSPEVAEKLTVELANRRQKDTTPVARDLPKIQGKTGG